MKEEINAEIKDVKLRFVIENIFTYLDDIGHEIDFIYEARFVDQSLYHRNEIIGHEGSISYKAVWKSINDFNDNTQEKLVPDGLLDLLLSKQSEKTSRVEHIRTKKGNSNQ